MTRNVVVLVPRRPARAGAVDSQLMAAAHLARGFAALEGTRATLVTEEGVADPSEVLDRSVRAAGAATASRLARLPLSARLLVGDAQAVRRSARLRRTSFLEGVESAVGDRIDAVVQYHHRFQDAGRVLAARHGCPWILRVEALEVAEQRDWGMPRPWVGPIVTAVGERRLMRRADALCPVSAPLAAALRKEVVGSEPVTVPNGVDLDLFRPEGQVAPRPEDLEGRFLIGWAGGFRPYHGLTLIEPLVARLAEVIPDATLCLVGEGPMRAELAPIAARLPLSLRLVPPQPQRALPTWLRSFDVCLQLGRPDGAQHYSPLKVLEYLACGRPVVAPTAATTGGLVDGVDALLYPAGDVEGLVQALLRLRSDSTLRASLGSRGREVASARGSWQTAAAAVLRAAGVVEPEQSLL